MNTTIQIPNISPALPMFLKKALCFFAYYFDGDLHRFVLSTSGELRLERLEKQHESESRYLILIVSRSFYSEQVRTYPIENNNEVKKLLALEMSGLTSDEKENTFHYNWGSKIGSVQNVSKVNFWQFNNELPSSFLKLPESLLLAITIKNAQVIQRQGVQKEAVQSLYITRLDNTVHSLVQTNIINSVQRFSMSVGIAQSEQVKVVERKYLAAQLAFGIKKLTLPLLMSFVQLPHVDNRLDLLKRISFSSFFILALYLSATSGYLTFKQNALQIKLDSQNEEVSNVLQKQVSFDQQLTRYTAFKQFLSKQQAYSPLWLVMADLFPVAQFTNVRIVQDRFVLRGTTKKATQLLEILSKSKRVKNAKFDFPTRRNRNKDVFVISFELVSINNEGGGHG